MFLDFSVLASDFIININKDIELTSDEISKYYKLFADDKFSNSKIIIYYYTNNIETFKYTKNGVEHKKGKKIIKGVISFKRDNKIILKYIEKRAFSKKDLLDIFFTEASNYLNESL